LLAGGVLFHTQPAAAHSSAKLWTDEPDRRRPALMPDFVRLAAQLSPAVVNISVEQSHTDEDQSNGGDTPGLPDDNGGTPVHGLGSGFIINKAGYILTNNHVIAGATTIKVTTRDGNRYFARLIGTDPRTDVALIKINSKLPLPVAPLGDSRNLRVGEWVMAIGDPFGFDHSVTVGVVSARGRFIPGSYNEFIQTDASINPGNSGGPLIDAGGGVVGVTSAIYTRTGAFTGISFAIPIDIVKRELPELAIGRRIVRGWLGVYIEKVTPDVASAHGLAQPRGALVAEVVAGGPAAKAGIQSGDIIISYQGEPIGDSQQLPFMVGDSPIGQAATLGVIRGRRQMTVRVKIEVPPSNPAIAAAESGSGQPASSADDFGMIVKKVPSETGLVVNSVMAGSPAAEAGVRADDIILEVNRRPVSDPASFHDALTAHVGSALLLLRRGKVTVFISVPPAG
jgi:serine protease Do